MWTRVEAFFFFNDTATTEIYTLSLHDALPISVGMAKNTLSPARRNGASNSPMNSRKRSEEHTSELQSPCNLVCRLLLEKKKKRDQPPARRDQTVEAAQGQHVASILPRRLQRRA